MDWIELAQDMDRWWALVNAAMNARHICEKNKYVILFRKNENIFRS